MWPLLLMYVLFATVFSIGKKTLLSVEPFFFSFVRMMMAGCILIGFQLLFKIGSLKLAKKDLFPLLMVGVFNVFVTNALEFWGLKFMGSGKTGFIYTIAPFFSIILSYLIFSEKMTKQKWLGLFLGVLGISPIYFLDSSDEVRGPLFSYPEIAVSIAAMSCVVGWIYFKKLVNNRVHFVTINSYSFLIGGLFSLIPSIAFENWDPIPVTSWKPFIWGTAYIILIHNLICYNIYGYNLGRFSLPFVNIVGFISPLVALIIGWFFLEEKLSMALLFCFIPILLGIYLYFREELKAKSLALKS